MQDYHEGLGTVYERFMLNRLFDKLLSRHGFKSVLETPIGGMVGVPGINSVFLARKGCTVTINDTDRKRLEAVKMVLAELGDSIRAELVDIASLPYPDSSFDLVWNFGVLWNYKNSDSLISEMARVSRKHVLIFIPNRIQFAYPLRRYVLERGRFRKLNLEWIKFGRVKRELRKSGLRIIRTGVIDSPPWPDIAMAKEEITGKKPKRRWSMMDYLKGDKSMGECIRYSFFESLPLPQLIKLPVSHHRFILAEK